MAVRKKRSMSLLEYLRVVVQRGWIVLLFAAAAAAALVVISSRQTPIYRATQVLIVSPRSADLDNSLANRNLLNSYVVYLNSTFVASEIAEALDMGISGAELKGRAEIAAVPDRLTIEINVNDTDGNSANQVAYLWGQKLLEFLQARNENLPSDDHIDAVMQDLPQYVLYRPRTLVNAALGGLAGAVVGGLVVFALEFRRSRVVRDLDDLQNLRGLSMTVIPDEQQIGTARQT
jgi:capsular polysaccharide biosynthesis protein